MIIVASPAQAPTRCKGFREALRGSEVAHVDSKKFCVVDGMESEDEIDRLLADSNELGMIDTNAASVLALASDSDDELDDVEDDEPDEELCEQILEEADQHGITVTCTWDDAQAELRQGKRAFALS